MTRFHMYKTNYQNKTFQKEIVELDDHSFKNCTFKECMIIIRKGETELKNCEFASCHLILKDNALTIGKIIKMFTRESPLRVVDYEEGGSFRPAEKRKDVGPTE